MNNDKILQHLYMMRASTKTMLTNLKESGNQEAIDDLLDTLSKLNEEIERLEKLKKDN